MLWLVAFMTFIVANGATVVTENAVTNATKRGGVVDIVDHEDHGHGLRRKLAHRLGMAEHPDDASARKKESADATPPAATRRGKLYKSVFLHILVFVF